MVDKYGCDMYKICMDTIRFEWDENKNIINQEKHGVSFEEAKTVFYDEFFMAFLFSYQGSNVNSQVGSLSSIMKQL
ncbi:BrnT family toxin [Butyrivibrio sp. MC2013]|uniref:BrnT family toxin n=1 Tax=Butyrivibrio sp. MC2013 TaxID=1280686 RepID=UPI000404084E|nr:BrnT family toxin [Butyrivibrio sp. MC2013]